MRFGKQFWVEELGEKWALQLKDTLRDPYMGKLMDFLSTEYALNTVYPPRKEIFNAFKFCPWDKLKIVILGQSPHLNGEANGLCFADRYTSTYHSTSLCKIYECIEREYCPQGFYLDFDFTLEKWAKQGVLLLNTSLTTRKESNESHKKPWKKFISAVLNNINEYSPGTIFILWGKEAQALIPHIKEHNHILSFNLPSNEDWHCPNFKEADKIIMDLYRETIKW
tara:strand:- start:969 stop:1640 length:672 start_codon:yes stop_codon:yes gene_type:complete